MTTAGGARGELPDQPHGQAADHAASPAGRQAANPAPAEQPGQFSTVTSVPIGV